MAHEITCVSRSSPRPPAHPHILTVTLADGRRQSVETVRFRIEQGDRYFTYGAGRAASVRSYDCLCGAKTIRSGPDAVMGNDLANLAEC